MINLETKGWLEKFFVGLHNHNRATAQANADLRWDRGMTPLDPGILSDVDLDLSGGEFCMTMRLDQSSDRMILQDEPCTSELAAITETDCYDLGKQNESLSWILKKTFFLAGREQAATCFIV